MRAAALLLEQKGEAERFVEDVRKRVRWVDRNGSEQRLDRLGVEIIDVLASRGPQLA